MVAQVTCMTPDFKWRTKQYALKVCFNFELDTNQARSAYINEFIELVKLPSHPNIVRFLCEFVDEVHDNIRSHLPDFARASSIKIHRDGTRINRKTQFFVLEHVEMSLARLLESRFAPPSIVPHRMVATIISQVGSGLRHLDAHRLAHRDIKSNNIMVETRVVDEMTNEIEITRCVLIDFGDESQSKTRSGAGLLSTISVRAWSSCIRDRQWQPSNRGVSRQCHISINRKDRVWR